MESVQCSLHSICLYILLSCQVLWHMFSYMHAIFSVIRQILFDHALVWAFSNCACFLSLLLPRFLNVCCCVQLSVWNTERSMIVDSPDGLWSENQEFKTFNAFFSLVSLLRKSENVKVLSQFRHTALLFPKKWFRDSESVLRIRCVPTPLRTVPVDHKTKFFASTQTSLFCLFFFLVLPMPLDFIDCLSNELTVFYVPTFQNLFSPIISIQCEVLFLKVYFL